MINETLKTGVRVIPHLHNGVRQLSHGHAPRKPRSRIPISDVGNQLEPKLASIEHPLEYLHRDRGEPRGEKR